MTAQNWLEWERIVNKHKKTNFQPPNQTFLVLTLLRDMVPEWVWAAPNTEANKGHMGQLQRLHQPELATFCPNFWSASMDMIYLYGHVIHTHVLLQVASPQCFALRMSKAHILRRTDLLSPSSQSAAAGPCHLVVQTRPR